MIQKLAAKLSLQAYQDIPNAIKIVNRWTSTVAYVHKTEDCNYVVFRGTNSPLDWVFNLSALPWYYNGRWCHAGFVATHKSTWKQIRRQLDPNKKTLVCGHSLGGALAELTAWACRDFTDLSMVTFGKPNVFFRGSKKKMGHKVQISYVSGSDVVTRLPKFGYVPDSNQDLVYFDNWGRIALNPPTDYIKNDFGLGDSVSDHSMVSYEKMVNDYPISIAELRSQSEPLRRV